MIELNKIDGHIHVETPEMTPYTALKLINEQGLHAALVDHVFSDRHRITPTWIKEECRCKFPEVDFIHGCEVDVYGNGLIALPERLVAAMDFIMVSFTHAGQPGVVNDEEFEVPEKLAVRLMYLLNAAVDWPFTDVIAHPFALSLNPVKTARFIEAVNLTQLHEILQKAARLDIKIEINARTLRRMPVEPQKLFLRAALECRCVFTIGSDAHTLDEIGQTDEALEIIEELHIPAGAIVPPACSKKRKPQEIILNEK